MRLLIVESPAKAKTVGKYLGKEWTVKASVGHIRDIPKSNKKAIDIAKGFVPHYELAKGKEEVVKELKAAAKKADEVVLATDPDREGEAIAWHIAETIGLKNPKRIVFHEITKDAILEAVGHARAIDMNLKQAQEARRVLDRLVGYDLSGLIWKKVRYGLSAGRVQSPALRILVEKEREIKAFISEKFWVITASVQSKKGDPFLLTCVEEPRDEKEVERIVSVGKAGTWTISAVEETNAKRATRAPFTTSTLQQTASSRLGYSPGKTMSIAQKLYEAGHITYMRTDSTNLSEFALGNLGQAVIKEFGAELHEAKRYATRSKNAQEAHEAVRPTDSMKRSAGTTPEQKRLYELIRARALASQMKDAQILRTKIVASVAGIPDFTVTGSQTVYPGWLLADPAAKGEDVELPKVAKDEKLTLNTVSTEEKATQPPARYTEAGLVKELEKRGIGRPSTYASIISTLEKRGYVEYVGRSLKPTDTGEVVSGFLEEHFPSYISDTFTAQMENDLDDIAAGTKEYKKTLSDFYGPFSKDVKSKDGVDKATNLGEADEKFKCPKCGSRMQIKLGRGGRFLSCSTYPACDGALTLEGFEVKKDEPIGTDPETGLPIYVLVGRFGPYVQRGEKVPKGSKEDKPKMASIPRGVDIATVTLADALKYLSLPKKLGEHPTTGKTITANVGRFGPYIVHDGDFRSVKVPDDVYTIALPRALEIFAQPKATRKGRRKKE